MLTKKAQKQERKSIEIRPPGYNHYREGVEISNETRHLLPEHFVTLIIGRPGSGKSHLLFELITNPDLYRKRFNAVFFITPGKIGDLPLTPQNSTTTFSTDWIFKRIDEINVRTRESIKAGRPPQHTINVLFVLDDVVGYLQKQRFAAAFQALFYNRRHLLVQGTVSFFVTSQYYKAIPRMVRANATTAIIFDVIPEDMEILRKEVIYCKDARLIMRVAEKIFSMKHHFLYVRMDTGGIFSDFKTEIYSPDSKERSRLQEQRRALEEELAACEMEEEEEPPGASTTHAEAPATEKSRGGIATFTQTQTSSTVKPPLAKPDTEAFLRDLYKKYGL